MSIKDALDKKAERARAAGRKEAIQAAELVAQKQKPTIIHIEPQVDTKQIADAQLQLAQILEKHLSGQPLPIVEQEMVVAAIKGLKFDTGGIDSGLNAVC